ncbi:hypothetical protein [Priestia taiwanensis]|uniref:YhfM-like domain-containing protein n=1 Tax=Priestia taiwanensis TaxID=1347902 RepID=A0A917AS21_9BACI|nr:hypothetical protein [Priestia taiwanensis]MBM7363990.1 hypothetical protein [Priestia taiwanensis]GGE70784.1 hypothetical protein GCM10007140_20800 [Priestia taiwanensis]
MKKIMIAVWVITIGGLGYLLFFHSPNRNLPNASFFTIKDIKTKHLKETIHITEKEKLSDITNILNQSKSLSKNIDFKLAGEPNLEMRLTYENTKEEKLSIWDDFEKGQTLISSDATGYYKLNDTQYEQLLRVIHVSNPS